MRLIKILAIAIMFVSGMGMSADSLAAPKNKTSQHQAAAKKAIQLKAQKALKVKALKLQQANKARSLQRMKMPRLVTRAPLAYNLYCLKSPKDCRASGPKLVKLDAKTISSLNRVNSSVNRSMRYVSDKGDTWGARGGSGDCEDFALEKRHQLIKSGIPAAALRMAAVKTKRGEYHAVLVVKTSKGDLVLDSIEKTIKAKSRTGYTWRAVATSNPLKWQSL